jgi:predicted peptidase
MDQTRENTTAIDIFTVIAILLIVGLPVYGYFKLKPDRIFHVKETPTEESSPEEKAEPPLVITGYTQELVEIDGQWAYIAVPEPIDPENLPTLIIYNHGTETRVEEVLDEEFKKILDVYAETSTPHNYIFAVSNARGFDLDTPEAIDDNYNLYIYIKQKYGIQEQIYMSGYSKGGVATLNFTSTYPNLVNKIGMIAPRMRLYEWDRERAQSLDGISIKVWHGTGDVNVAYKDSVEFIEQMKEWGIEIDLVTLEGRDHWDVNPQYFDEVIQFFNQSQTAVE